ncbi:MAG TPA: MlaD family protein [Verrucomicrobiae bacterium]|jgi:ABC-type transporter Mla subunit MlaD
MALNDLTPQLRTRLSKVERVVGIFVTVATLLLLSGFFYYLWHTAQRKGWFKTKLPYYTYVDTGVGLKVGDAVKLMGFNVGEITQIEAMPPDSPNDVIVRFVISEPHYGYIWNDSKVKIAATDFLGGRSLEVTKGGTSGETNKLAATFHDEKRGQKRVATEIWDQERDGGGRPFFDRPGKFKPWDGKEAYWLEMDEAPALTERLDKIVKKAEDALPNILALTNRLQLVLDNAAGLTSNLNTTIVGAQPVVTNLQTITANIRDPKGSLGEWLIPTNVNAQLQSVLAELDQTLAIARRTVDHTDTNLMTTLLNLNLTLVNLANMTSNLHVQVEQNTNLVSSINNAIIQADTFLQGLKRHWLLRSAFKEKKTNAPAAPTPAARSGSESIYPGRRP